MVERDAEGNETPYFDFDFIVRKYFGMSDEDLKLNQRYKDEKKLRDEGYKQEDIAKILDGTPKDEFKPKKSKKKDTYQPSQLVYNIPGHACVSIWHKGVEWTNKTLPIAQFGVDMPIPTNLFTSPELPSIIFSEKTGNIISISK